MKELGIAIVFMAILITGCGDDKSVTPVEQNAATPGLSIMRADWWMASWPKTVDSTVSERAHVAWFNPPDGIPVSEIWDRDIGTGKADVVNVMEIHFKPVDHKFVRDTVHNIIDSTSVPIDPERSWAGFMTNPPTSLFTTSYGDKFLNIRIRVGRPYWEPTRCVMHLDIGRISEDTDGDGRLDTENPDPRAIISDEEDVGLDGLPDQFEFGYDPRNGITDPAGDDFAGDNIWRINGTEGNRVDPARKGHADTEDPNLNGLELSNNYYSYAIDIGDTLSPHSFYVDGTMNEYGWMTLRVPLTDERAVDTIIGQPSWDWVSQVRIWFDSGTTLNLPPDGYEVEIAAMELMTTGWSSVIIPADSLRSDPRLGMYLVSKETDRDYTPSPGYTPSYQLLIDVLAYEQVLGLAYDNLQAGIPVYTPDSGLVMAADTVMAERESPRILDLRQYCWLDAYVWGDARGSGDSTMFFFRFGTDSSRYYEYRTILHPGWDAGNHVHADLRELEALTSEFLADRAHGFDSSLIRYTPSGSALVKLNSSGYNPYTGAVKYMAAGVVNFDASQPADGRVWISGIRLTGWRF
jgi:hypothetical protein